MAIDPDEARAREVALVVEAEVGHPQQRWDMLVQKVEGESVRLFSEVSSDFLALMWCLDRYRVADAPPIDMGRPDLSPGSRIDGIYRGKGNWLSILLGLLLGNRTGQTIRSVTKIRGYSQLHQIDLAWPDRDAAPIVCAETKVTGGPAYRRYPARRAMDDWTNRRKELKFAATDLKLSRREQTTKIGHWASWRAKAAPKTFMLWGARLTPRDSIEKMLRETEILLGTYLDGAGVLAWRENENGDGYEPVYLASKSRVEDLDGALWQIESEISDAVAGGALDEVVQLAGPADIPDDDGSGV